MAHAQSQAPADVWCSPQVRGAACADGFCSPPSPHQFERIVQFILNHPIFYKIKPKAIRSSISLSQNSADAKVILAWLNLVTNSLVGEHQPVLRLSTFTATYLIGLIVF